MHELKLINTNKNEVTYIDPVTGIAVIVSVDDVDVAGETQGGGGKGK